MGNRSTGDYEQADVERVFKSSTRLSRTRGGRSVHRDLVDDTMAGILAGYLVYSQLVDDPILASALIQEILKRPLGPEGRSLIPVRS